MSLIRLLLLSIFAVSLGAQAIPTDFFANHMDVGPTNGSTPILAPMVVGAHGKPAVTDWEYIETSRGVYNWNALDQAVSRAQTAGTPIFVSHQWVPPFATSDPATCGVNGLQPNQCSAAPADLNISAPCQGSLAGTTTTDCVWKEFLTSLVQRYKSTGIQTGCSSGSPQCHGVIQMYEGWNEPPFPTPMALADFVMFETDFLNTIRSNDASAKVGSPAFIIDPSVPSYATFMANFFANGGPKTYNTFDFHINAAQPEAQIALINQFKSILSTAGVSNPVIYATEAGRSWSCTAGPPSDAAQQAYVGRIEPIYWANGIKRHYWYAYSICGPQSNQTASNTLTPLGIAYGNVANWMLGSTMGTLSQSTGDPLNSTFTANLTKSGTTNIIAWHSGAGAAYTPPSGYTSYTDVNGVTHAVSGSVALTNSPILLVSAPAVQAQWSMGFLESAQDPAQRALVNYSAVTHIIDFGVHPVSNGTLTCDFGSELCNSPAFTTARADLISAAHSHGVKVLMCVTDANGAGGFAGAASSGTLSTFVANIMSMVNTNGYDGVDLDWEASSYTTLMPGLISALRTSLGSTRLLAVDAIPGTQTFWGSNYAVLDRVNFMTYDQEGNFNPYTWFNAALFSDPGDGEWSLDLMKRRAIAAGIPAGRFNLGIPFYGYTQTGPTGPRQSVAGNPPLTQIRYSNILSTYPSQSANPTVDSVAKVPWFAITGGWVEYDNPASVTAKVNYIKTNNLGGWILFSLNKDASGQPLAAAVASAMGGGGGSPSITTFSSNPSVISPGGSSTLTIATSGATSCSLSPGSTVTCNGTVLVSPSASTLYTLTATNTNGSTTSQTQVTVSGPTNYFVSSSGGNDNNAGTSSAAPWQSLVKVKAGPAGGYAPGTIISFKSGDTWSGVSMSTLSDGTSPSRITYNSYGAGAKPIIDGTATVATLFNIADNFITIDGLDLRNSTSQLMTAPGKNGIIVKNCSFRNAGGHVFNSSFAISGDITFDNNTYTVDAGRSSSTNMVEIWTDQNSTIQVTNNSLDRRLASGALNGSGIVITGAWGAVMTGNVVRGGTQGIGVKPYQRPSDGVNCQPGDAGTQNGIISHNYMDNISTRQGDGEAVELEGCIAGSGGDQTGFTVSNNVIVCMSDNTVGVGSSDAIGGFHASGSKVWGNLIFGGCGIATGSTTPRMITFSSASTNNNVYNNTIVGPGTGVSPFPLSGIAYLSSSSGIARNNIITGVERGVAQYTSATVSQGNNLFFDVSSNTFGTVTDLGNTLVGDPLFTVTNPTSANGAKLLSGSPAVGSGANLGSPYNLINDPNGAGPFIYPDFNQSSLWMRGAFGFGGGPPPPIITDFEANPTSINSGQSSQLTCTASNFTNLQIVGVGNIASGVPISVSPTSTTQYICRATNTVTHVDAFATVTVNAPPPVITSFTASPVAIITGQSSTLQWTTTGATTCSINNGVGTVGCNTSRVVTPAVTTAYRLTATNSVSVSDFQDVTIAVNVPKSIKGAVMQGAIIP